MTAHTQYFHIDITRRNSRGPNLFDIILVKINRVLLSMLSLGNVQDLLMELCCVAARHAPAYGIGVLLPDMLTIENSGWDALMIGLRALLTMLIAAPAWSRSNQQPHFEVRSFLLPP